MTDLISRKVVVDIAEIEDVFMRYSDGRLSLSVIVDIRALLESSPAMSGEAILYAVDGYEEALKIHNGATLCTAKQTDLHKVPLYTTPQQPQEQDELVKKAVADALEEVAKEIDLMVNTYIESGNKYHEVSEGRERCVNKARAAMSCAETIRAIIKRNVKG